MTASDPRVGEIQARLDAVSQWPDILPMPQSDVAYLLAELADRDEKLAKVEDIEKRLARSKQCEDREIAEDLRAAVAAAGGGGE